MVAGFRRIARNPLLNIFVCTLIFTLASSKGAFADKTYVENEKRAKAGDREAMFDHANCLLDTYCPGYTKIDVPDAIKWYKKAIELGQKDAIFMLGITYCDMPEYVEEGRRLLDRAIDLGVGMNTKSYRENCGKKIKSPSDPNKLIESLLSQYKARGKMIKEFNEWQKKGLISNQGFLQMKTRIQTGSAQEIFVYWGVFQEGRESFLNFIDAGPCEYDKTWKVVFSSFLRDMNLRRDGPSMKKFQACSISNLKKSLFGLPKTEIECALKKYKSLMLTQKTIILGSCANRELCRNLVRSISKKFCMG